MDNDTNYLFRASHNRDMNELVYTDKILNIEIDNGVLDTNVFVQLQEKIQLRNKGACMAIFTSLFGQCDEFC